MTTMKKQGYVLFLALLAVAALLPGSVAGDLPCEYSFNESHSEIYERMLEQNASLGEYYEQACPAFLEGMPPEVRAHVYGMPMSRHLDCNNVTFVPPGKQVAIGIASPGDAGKVGPGILALFGIGTLILLAVAWFALKQVRNRKE
ncbi:MAG: hypothetical protein CVV31_07865 [Methanomicrobiales archaeon HGW-Methanomicrobiales-2]|jgi:hypothetical protein|nr:MAG: hypothetical protein CVV31_07865 [Methanomicrobiales archaeon HGW-Methanomicrobiales-2]